MRVPMKGMLCGWCGKPVTRHGNAIEEKVPWPSKDDPQQLRKQLWHRKRCWSKEVRQRVERIRAEKHAEKEQVIQGLELEPELEVALREAIVRGEHQAVEVVRATVREQPDEYFEARVVSGDELVEEQMTSERLDGGEKTKRGDLVAAVRLVIEAHKGKWWTRAMIKKEVLELGITNSPRDSIGQAIIAEARYQRAERRVLDGHTLEYRVVATESVAALPPMLPPKYEPKVGKQVEERHSTRPLPWQRASGAERVHSEVEEVAVTVNGKVQGKAGQHTLFMLKSERMLAELERNLTAMVRSAVEQTRQQIEKLVEEELE